MNEMAKYGQMAWFLQYGRDDAHYPRTMGSKNSHAVSLQNHLHDQMVAQSEFCDVTLISGNIEMKAHWAVMVSCPYFQSLYDSNMTERKEGRVVIGIGKPTAIRAAINFLYTGVVEISYSGVKDILEVADYLQIDDLKKACTDYLASIDINVENCVELSLLASLYDLELYTRVFEFVRGHLPEVMKQPEMLSLTPESILDMLEDKSLNYVTADEFFNFIVRWVEKDVDTRKHYFEAMFCELELKNMTSQFLEKVVENSSLVSESDKCKVKVLNIKMRQMTGLMQNEDMKDVILLVGGSGVGQFFSSFFSSPFFPLSDVMAINNVYAYVVHEDRWTELAPLPYTMRQPLVAFNSQTSSLFVIDNSNYTTTCIEQDTYTLFMFKYNVVERMWTSLRIKLPDGWRDISIYNILIANNKVFILAWGRFINQATGEKDMEVCLLKVSEDLQTSDIAYKLFVKNMKTKIMSCVVDNRYVCVLGTKCGKGHSKAHKPVRFLFYDARMDHKVERSKAGFGSENLMIPMKNELYVTKYGYHKYFRFNFNDKKWTIRKELLVSYPPVEASRADYIYTAFNSELYVFGGKSTKSKELLNSACKYNFQTKTWAKLEDIPKSIFQSGITAVKVPTEHVRCHIDCPHCKYHTARSLASYEIDYPDDEDEEEDEVSYEEDEDVYTYSDYWDDDFYNEYSDTDWF